MSMDKDVSTYLTAWIFKAFFLTVVLLILMNIYHSYLYRDYDTKDLELLATEHRLRYCLRHEELNIGDCFSHNRVGIEIEAKGNKELYNENLHQHKALCTFQKRFSCKEQTMNIAGVHYKTSIVLDGDVST